MKTNIGHTEAASGIAGLIKAILCVQHRQIPANLHLKEPNPEIAWDSLPFDFPDSTQPWLEPEGRSRERLALAPLGSVVLMHI